MLRSALVGVIIGNMIEAGADIGGMAAAMGVLAPRVTLPLIALPTTVAILAFQVWDHTNSSARVFDGWPWTADQSGEAISAAPT